jgi:hypothetical protein
MTKNKENRSGDPAIDRKNNYYTKVWEETIDKTFAQLVFFPFPALMNKELVNGNRNWKPYYGGEYDKEKFDLVKDMWDHEHCSICNFKITEGNTYWSNTNRIRLLCDECHDYYSKPL